MTVAETKQAAMEQLRLATKIYIEYGLITGRHEDISFPDPVEHWERLTPDSPVSLMEPIEIDHTPLLWLRLKRMQLQRLLSRLKEKLDVEVAEEGRYPDGTRFIYLR